MHIGAKRVDRQVQHIADQEDDDEHEHARNPFSSHGSHGVEHLGDNAGGQSERKKP